MRTRNHLLAILVGLAFLLSACAGASDLSAPTASPEPTETTAPPSTETAYPTIPPTLPPARPETTPITSEPLLSLRQRLAEQLGFEVEAINLLEMRQETWSDGCLGAALPGEMCTMAIVPGYLIYFDTPKGKIEVHTDESMRNYRIVSLLVGSGGTPLVSWSRSGGIAGICWQMHIFMDGTYQLLDCFTQETLAMGTFPLGTMQDILAMAADMAPHQWATSPVLGADMFTDAYAWFGPGNQPPDTLAQEQLNAFLGGLASTLVK